VSGLWIPPLGLVLIAEGVPIVRRGLSRIDRLEKRRPGAFKNLGGN
jgi:hypothetical protein